jgi:hypothetical protein
MSLLMPRITTAARLAAGRRNSQKSTGPRTPRGKAQLRINLLRGGGSSSAYRNLLRALVEAPPGGENSIRFFLPAGKAKK